MWVLNHYAQEPGGPGGTRHYSLAYHLASLGWKAQIIAASTELNTGRQRLSGGETARLDQFNGVDFLWLRTPPYSGNGLGRMINMAAYTFRALKPSNLTQLDTPHVIIGSSVHPLAAWAGLRLATRYRVPFIFEVRDLWPQTLIDMGKVGANSPQARILRSLEKYLYKSADRIITLLPRAYEYIESMGIGRSKVEWIPNGVDLDGFPWRSKEENTGVFTFMYFGAHGDANGLENLLDAMSYLQSANGLDGIRLRLIGDGPNKAALMQKAQDLSLTQISFEDPVPKSEIPSLAAQADAFIFNLIDAPVFQFGISSNKLFDFMAAGRPIIFCCDAGNNPVDDAKGGITVPPGVPVKLAEAMKKLVFLPREELQMLGDNARNYVKRVNDYKSLAGKLAVVLNTVTSK